MLDTIQKFYWEICWYLFRKKEFVTKMELPKDLKLTSITVKKDITYHLQRVDEE